MSAAAILHALLDGPAGPFEIADRIGARRDNTGKQLRDLYRAGLVEPGERRGRERPYMLTAEGERRARSSAAPPPPKSATRQRSLPTVQGYYLLVAGERRDDCVHEDDCTTAHALAYSGPASCPRECRWFERAEPMHAVDYASSGRSNGEAAIYVGASDA